MIRHSFFTTLFLLLSSLTQAEAPWILSTKDPLLLTPKGCLYLSQGRDPIGLPSLLFAKGWSPQRTDMDALSPLQRLERCCKSSLLRHHPPVQITSIPGGFTNSNFRVDTENQTYFARVCGKESSALDIEREVEIATTNLANRFGLSPKVVAFYPNEGVLITEFVHGVTLPHAYFNQPRLLKQVAFLMRRCHQMPVTFPKKVTPFQRIRTYIEEAKLRQLSLPSDFDLAMKRLNKIEQVLEADPTPFAPCHLDVHADNILHTGRAFLLVDWEFAAMAHPFLDLGLCASTAQLSLQEERNLLHFYTGNIDEGERSLLYLYRTVADLYWALWCFLQEAISETDSTTLGEYGNLSWERFMERTATPLFHRSLLTARHSSTP